MNRNVLILQIKELCFEDLKRRGEIISLESFTQLAKQIVDALYQPDTSKFGFDDYQRFAISTAIYPNRGKNLQYVILGLCGEAGEVANKVKKIDRDLGGRITEEYRDKISEELGDLLWYVAMASKEINLSLGTIIARNVVKLKDRQKRNVVKGSGDRR